MRHNATLSIIAAAALLAGCANMSDTQRHTATGAGIGALGGAALGAIAGDSAGTGAVVGAGLGALGGYIWSQHMEQQKRDMQAATQGSGVTVVADSGQPAQAGHPERHFVRHRPRGHRTQSAHRARPLRAEPARQPRHRGAHHRPHRLHGFGRGQRPALGGARQQHAQLPDRSRSRPRAHPGGGARLARTHCQQRHGRGPRAQPPRRDLRGRASTRVGASGGAPMQAPPYNTRWSSAGS